MQAMKIIIIGRTQTGKTALARRLADVLELKVLKSHTDRPRRTPDEDTYHFHTPEEAAAIPDSEKPFLTTALDGFQRWTNEPDILDADVCILDEKGIAPATELYHSHGHSVLIVYAYAPEKLRRRKIEELAAGSANPKATRILMDVREELESPAFDRIHNEIEAYFAERARKNPEKGIPVPFGADMILPWCNDYSPPRLNAAVAIVQAHRKAFDKKTKTEKAGQLPHD